MLFVYLVIAIALILYIRFFILRSLLTKENRINTVLAATKAVYFTPLFIQGFLLLWVALRNFKTICGGLFLSIRHWRFKGEEEPDYDFLYLVGYLCVGSLLLGLHALLGKLSLSKKTDPASIFYKIAYITTSYFLLKVVYLNAGLFNPLEALLDHLFFYNNTNIIVAGSLAYAALLLQLFFKPLDNHIKYLQVGVLSSAAYLFFCVLLALLLFGIYAIVKLIS
ncbi:MAG TPA: hypothetical protein VF476_04030 [Chitinophagaceae bacterium]